MKKLAFFNLTDSPAWKPRSESLTRRTRGKGPHGSIWDVWAFGHCELRQWCELHGKAKPHDREIVSTHNIDFAATDASGKIERRFVAMLPDQKSLDSADLALVEAALANILDAICAVKPSIDYQKFRKAIGKTRAEYSPFLLDDLDIHLRVALDSFQGPSPSAPVSYDTATVRSIVQLTAPNGIKAMGTYEGDLVLRQSPDERCGILRFEESLFAETPRTSPDNFSAHRPAKGPAQGKSRRIDKQHMPPNYRGALLHVWTNASSSREAASRMSEQLMPTVIVYDNGDHKLTQALLSWADAIATSYERDSRSSRFEGRESLIDSIFSWGKSRK